jgi:sialate O-acetylesterase
MKRIMFIVVSVALLAGGRASAEVKLHALFSDHAVLQQAQPVPVWGTAKDGEKVTVTFAGQTVTTTAKDGRWKVSLQPLKANATPQSLTVAGENTVTVTNILVGEVWVCSGQSNMQWGLGKTDNAAPVIAAANDPQLRLFYVPREVADTPQADVAAKWEPCTPQTAEGFSAVAYYFGRDLRKAKDVPVGLIHTSWGGTTAEAWTSRKALESDPLLKPIVESWDKQIASYDPVKQAAQEKAAEAKRLEAGVAPKASAKPAPKAKKQGSPAKNQNRAAGLYNAMIAPLVPYAMQGAIWYQGESNNGRTKEYQTLFPAMIKCWREDWQREFPFLFVQIAPHKGMSPQLREAQLLTWQRTPKTSMVVITDYGDAGNIHPQKKAPVGARLALAARAIAYGEKIDYSGPVFESMKVDRDRAVLTFTHLGGGLVAKGGNLKGFTISGTGTNFVPAEAVIEGDTVVVTGKDVAAPGAVRYGWDNVPDVNLFNKADLPASPFRTDVE